MADVIVNHVLFYIANKYTTSPRDKIVENVVKFYADFDELNDAKKLLYEKTNKNFTSRRGDDKLTKTAQDIVETFVTCDNGGVNLPTFAATELGRIPVTPDGAVTMEQVMLVIASMNARLGDVEKTISGKIINVSAAKSALTPSALVSAEEADEDRTNNDSSLPTAASENLGTNPWNQHGDRRAQVQRPGFASRRQPSATRQQPHQPRQQLRQQHQQPRQSSRQRQNGMRNRQTFIGKKVMTGEMSWGGVELLSHRYIGNVNSSVTAEMIENDIKSRGVDVVKLEENTITKHSRFKSFKLTVKRNDKEKVDDHSFWPMFVVCRPWYQPRQPPADHDGTTAVVEA